MSAANQRGVDLGLNDDEVVFYDALAANDSAVEAMGKDELKVIATERVTQVRKSVTIDWTLRESARAKIKVMVSASFESTAIPTRSRGRSDQDRPSPSRATLQRLGQLTVVTDLPIAFVLIMSILK